MAVHGAVGYFMSRVRVAMKLGGYVTTLPYIYGDIRCLVTNPDDSFPKFPLVITVRDFCNAVNPKLCFICLQPNHANNRNPDGTCANTRVRAAEKFGKAFKDALEVKSAQQGV